jgi:hypothetical protein
MPNRALWWITGFILTFLTLATSVPLLRELFSFAPLHLWEVGLIVLMGIISILIAESVKLRPFRFAAATKRRAQRQ